jgi:hypothetical protein
MFPMVLEHLEKRVFSMPKRRGDDFVTAKFG